MKKRVKRKGRRSVIEKNTADFNKEFGSQPRRGLGEKKPKDRPSRPRRRVSRSPHARNREEKGEIGKFYPSFPSFFLLCGLQSD